MLGLNMSEAEKKILWAQLDNDNSGEVSIAEFREWMRSMELENSIADPEVVEWRQMANEMTHRKSTKKKVSLSDVNPLSEIELSDTTKMV